MTQPPSPKTPTDKASREFAHTVRWQDTTQAQLGATNQGNGQNTTQANKSKKKTADLKSTRSLKALANVKPERPTLIIIKGYWPRLFLLIPLTILDVALDSGMTLSYKYLIDFAIKPQDQRMLGIILSILGVGVIVSSALALFRDHYYAKTVSTIMAVLRQVAFDRCQRFPVWTKIGQSSSELLARMSTDMGGVEAWLASAMHGMVVPALSVLIGTMTLYFVLSWQLALVATVLWIVVLIGPRLVAPLAANASYKKKVIETKMLGRVEELVEARRVIKAFGLERFTRKRFENVLGELIPTTTDTSFLGYLVERSTVISICVLQFVVVAAGTTLAFRGEVTVGSLVTFFSLYWNLGWSLVVLSRSGPSVVAAWTSMQRLDELLSAEQDRADLPGALALRPLAKEIRFDNVKFAYPGRPAVLKGVSFTIKKGQFVAVVGPSGSGKSTVLNLIGRFYEPTLGTLSFDDIDTRMAKAESHREQLAVVFQDTYLFAISVRENIRLGRESATDEEIEQAAREAEIHDVIAKLPQGYDTVLGSDGASLSGGQKQRIAIARALVRKAPILLLDEATSALDPTTESAVNETLLRAGKTRTTIFVTHRLAAITTVDLILVVQEGKIVEQGDHNTLLAKQGVYAGLWSKQNGFVMSDDGAMAQITPERLKQIPLLHPLNDSQLQSLAPKFMSVRVSAGQAVISEGETASLFYIVVRGLVSVTCKGAEGDVIELARLGDGDQFGEMALLTDSPRTATVTTRTDCLLLTLNRAQFLELLSTTPDVKTMVEQIAAERQAAINKGLHHDEDEEDQDESGNDLQQSGINEGDLA